MNRKSHQLLESSIIALFLVSGLLGCNQSDREQPATSGNPIVEGWYADPEGLVLDGKYWVFPTYSARYEKQVFFDAFRLLIW